MEAITMQRPRAMSAEVADERDRLVKSWATVEIEDRQGETLLIHPYFDKIMPKLIDRGAAITLGHTDQIIGKILNYGFGINPNTQKEGLWLLWKMHSGYQSDDKIWDAVKSGQLYGLSFKGAGVEVPASFGSMDEESVIKILEGYGFALCGEPLSPPANSASIHEEINMLAKTHECKECGKPIEEKSKGESQGAACPTCGGYAVSQRGGGYYCPECHKYFEKTEKAERVYGDHRECAECGARYGAFDEKCPSCGSGKYYEVIKTGEIRELGQELKLISQPEQKNSSKNIHGGNSMSDETKDTTKEINFVTKEEYSKLETKMESISASLTALTDAVKAIAPVKKAEDEEVEDDKEEEKTFDAKVQKAVDEKMKDIVKDLGLTSKTPRPAQAQTPSGEMPRDVTKWLGDLHRAGPRMREVQKALFEREKAARIAAFN